MPVPKILISACLMGQRVRYNGGDCLQEHACLQKWINSGRVVMICPEMVGGLSTPRSPAEIQGGQTGIAVLQHRAKIMNNTGHDVTDAFIAGAQKTLALAQKHHVRVAILKAKSPSCGTASIYDGTFSRALIPGMGVTAALLNQHDILVFDEEHIDEALDAAESF